MSEFAVTTVYPSDRMMMEKVTALLQGEGIRLDANLDYTCAVVDEDYNVLATGSCFKNTLRCMAVSHEHQGEGLMNTVVSHLIDMQYQREMFISIFTQNATLPNSLPIWDSMKLCG